MNKIINFHDVKDVEWFDRVLTILKNKYLMIDIRQLEEFYYNGKDLHNSCHITVDDGDITFYSNIYPVLKKHKIPATIFVSPKIHTNKTNFWFQEIDNYDEDKIKIIISEIYRIEFKILQKYPMIWIFKNFKIDEIWDIIDRYKIKYNVENKSMQNITIDQLIEIDKHGLVSIGAHTLDHPVLSNETDERCYKEIIESIYGLGQILGHEIKYFAYPNGDPDIDFSQREMDILKSNNCKLAFSTQGKNFTAKDNPFKIPRYGLSFGNELFVRAKLLLGENWDKIKYLKSKGEKQSRIELKRKTA